MTNAYLDLTTLKSSGVLNITGAGLDSRLLPLLENVSRWIDDHCGRWFYSLTATRQFDGAGGPSPGAGPDCRHHATHRRGPGRGLGTHLAR